MEASLPRITHFVKKKFQFHRKKFLGTFWDEIFFDRSMRTFKWKRDSFFWKKNFPREIKNWCLYLPIAAKVFDAKVETRWMGPSQIGRDKNAAWKNVKAGSALVFIETVVVIAHRYLKKPRLLDVSVSSKKYHQHRWHLKLAQTQIFIAMFSTQAKY